MLFYVSLSKEKLPLIAELMKGKNTALLGGILVGSAVLQVSLLAPTKGLNTCVSSPFLEMCFLELLIYIVFYHLM